jgi:hypothetical protein
MWGVIERKSAPLVIKYIVIANITSCAKRAHTILAMSLPHLPIELFEAIALKLKGIVL